MITIVENSIDLDSVVRSVEDPAAGGVVLFLGTTRQFTRGRETLSLDYDCYREMALAKMEQLAEQARQRWPIVRCSLVHRIGHLGLTEASVAVAVSTPHRADAFDAAEWLIDELKKSVPIWKKENWADGTSQWVHPGSESS
ncbi:MAG: molybdenum cofactor biosynthesis protein MoaE [Pirellulaceae bacterium]|nr:molybdenum cofactor biosynthesis protein MoaE [Planctomycetales bacterium]